MDDDPLQSDVLDRASRINFAELPSKDSLIWQTSRYLLATIRIELVHLLKERFCPSPPVDALRSGSTSNVIVHQKGKKSIKMDEEKTCILIDDDEDDHYFFKAALRAQDVTIGCTYYLKPKEAMEKISQLREGKPSYIFIDLNMPQLTGLDCLRLLKQIPSVSDIPVVMYSTSASPTEIEESRRLGAVAYLVKPASIEELSRGLSVFFTH